MRIVQECALPAGDGLSITVRHPRNLWTDGVSNAWQTHSSSFSLYLWAPAAGALASSQNFFLVHCRIEPARFD